jgi:transposase-like protein
MEWESSEVSSLFAPSILTPDQYYDERRDDSAMRPIKRLMLAILEDALRCLQKHAGARSGARRLMFREAEHWLCSERGNALFSFTMVCETLGIEPEYLRLGVRQWRKMQPRGDLGQRVARRSPVVRIGSIVSENPARERTRRSRRKRGQPIMLNEPTSATVNSSAHAI